MRYENFAMNQVALFLNLGMRKEPLCPEVPMKPLYWTRILVPVVPTERGFIDAVDSVAQVIFQNVEFLVDVNER